MKKVFQHCIIAIFAIGMIALNSSRAAPPSEILGGSQQAITDIAQEGSVFAIDQIATVAPAPFIHPGGSQLALHAGKTPIGITSDLGTSKLAMTSAAIAPAPWSFSSKGGTEQVALPRGIEKTRANGITYAAHQMRAGPALTVTQGG